MPPVYVDLPGRTAKLDRRHTRYRFDLEGDVPWARGAAAGCFHPLDLLADLGVDVTALAARPDARADYDRALALATCHAFVELERGILGFVAEERDVLAASPSLQALRDEEEKHVALFVRAAGWLGDGAPELVLPFERARRAPRPEPFEARDRHPERAVRHLAFWLGTLFFEDYTIWLHERLATATEPVQPLWLAIHAAHRREEEQHVLTDVAHLDALALEPEARRLGARAFERWLEGEHRRWLALDLPDRVVRERFPEVRLAPPAPFAVTGLARALREHRLFERTRAALGHAPVPSATTVDPAPASRGGLRAMRSAAGRWLEGLAAGAREPAVPAVETFAWGDEPAPGAPPVDPEASLAPVSSAQVPPSASAPMLPVEDVRATFARVLALPLDAVGADASFADLGGDSVQAVEILTELEDRLGRTLGVELLAECRTPRELVAVIEGRGSSASAPGAARAARADEDLVAIVGAAGRFPGAADLDALWELLAAGRDAFRDVPPERWDGAALRDPTGRRPGTTVTTAGSFLDDVAAFDPEAFGLTDTDAAHMDPAQRLFLEVAADALEAVGPGRGRVGVFAAASRHDYFARLQREPERLVAASVLGNLANMVAARVAQVLGLEGPALTVDAACASSHVAIHLACRSLRAGECDVALAGGVQINLDGVPFVAFSQSGVLSRSGRCRPFSRAADGLVLGEGAGAVVLEPLARARALGHPVLAVVRGSAMNNDGGALSGMAPSPRGQVAVLRAALADARLDADRVDHVEAHGTGTSVGDAVEAEALAQVYGRGPGGATVGSVKSNLGHLLAAAGIASVLAVVLALVRRARPPLAGFDAPNPRAAFAPGGLVPAASLTPWPRRAERPRRAAVTGLGLGGTNCHLILEEAPVELEGTPSSPSSMATPLIAVAAAPSERALERVRETYAAALARRVVEGDAPGLAADVRALARRAARFPYRQAFIATDAATLARRLARSGEAGSGAAPRRAHRAARVAFVCSGPGSQHVGMARGLWDHEPVFRAALARTSRALRGSLERPLEALLFDDDPAAAAMDSIEVTQPVVFAVGHALGVWLAHLGVRPDAVLGHSAGEYVAASLAGALDPDEALALVVARGRAMSRTEPGAMLAVFAGEERVRAALAPSRALAGEDLGVAAVNDPAQVVLSGAIDAVARAGRLLEDAGIATRALPISCAAHSPLMRPAAAAFGAVARAAGHRPLAIPLYSTVTGARIAAGTSLAPAYWEEHLVAPVRFAAAVAAAREDGLEVFVEVGASGGLVPCVEASAGGEVTALPLVRRAHASSVEPTLEALGRLVERGVPVDLARLGAGDGAVGSPLTGIGYPYRRQRFWLDEETRASSTGSLPVASAPATDRRALATFRVAAASEPEARHHRARGRPIAPGARLMEVVLEALARAEDGDLASTATSARELAPRVLVDLVQGRPLPVDGAPYDVTVLRDGERIRLVSRGAAGEAVVHLSARVPTGDAEPSGGTSSVRAALDLEALVARARDEVPVQRLYDRLARSGLELGAVMRTVRRLRRGDGVALADLARERDAGDRERAFDPALVDGAMQAIGGFAVTGDDGEESTTGASPPTFLGFAVGRLEWYAPIPARAVAWVELAAPIVADAVTIRADVTIADEDGRPCARFERVGLKRVEDETARPGTRTVALLGSGADAMRVRRRLEDRDVFVLATALPSVTTVEEHVSRLGPIDGLIAVDPGDALLGSLVVRALPGPLWHLGPGGETEDAVVAAVLARLDRVAARPRLARGLGPAPTRGGSRRSSAGLEPSPGEGDPARGNDPATFLRGALARALGRDPGELGGDVPFPTLGVDSVMAAELVHALERRFALVLHPTLLFEHRTIDEVAAALAPLLAPLLVPAAAAPVPGGA